MRASPFFCKSSGLWSEWAVHDVTGPWFQVRVGLIQFGSTPRLEFALDLHTSKQELTRHLKKVPYRLVPPSALKQWLRGSFDIHTIETTELDVTSFIGNLQSCYGHAASDRFGYGVDSKDDLSQTSNK